MGEITRENVMTLNSLFCLIFGWGGKTGINCFVLITGYFMCKSAISAKKFIKLFFEMEFYKIIFYLIFIVSGYEVFSWQGAIKTLVPVYDLGTGFVESYLVFYLLIPYLNLLIREMNESQHLMLILLCLFCGMVLQTFLLASPTFTYVGWFAVLYFIAAYIRLYPKKYFENRKLCTHFFFSSLILSWGSIIVISMIYAKWGLRLGYYHFVDTNRILSVTTAVSGFLFFKNLQLKYHPILNKFAASVFGVLLIHANSNTMRRWLWGDVLKNTQAFHSNYFFVHAIVSVMAIYIIGTFIDMVRIQFLETPFFNWCDKNVIMKCKKLQLRRSTFKKIFCVKR